MKNYIVGIDVGGTATKICAFNINEMKLITPQLVRATDPLASIFGAFGKFTSDNSIELDDIEQVLVTGVGSSYVKKPLYGLPTIPVVEFRAIGLGGLYLSELDDAVVVSMGTGTALVRAQDGKTEYLGGTGVGGGTLMGLSRKLLNVGSIENIISLAQDGDLNKIDLRLCDITSKDLLEGLPTHTTVSNFGKINDLATKSDIAMGIVNLVFETIGMMSVFASRQYGIKDIVLTGSMTNVPQAKNVFESLSEMFKLNFVMPELSQYGTVIGTALSYFKSDS